MEQTIKINVPEGKKAVYDENTQTIKFVDNYDGQPKTWKEYCDNAKMVDGVIESRRTYCANTALYVYKDNEELITPIDALTKLMILRNEWVGDWEVDCGPRTTEKYYVATNSFGVFDVLTFFNIKHPLSFPIRAMAKEFMICFKDLLEEAKIFL